MTQQLGAWMQIGVSQEGQLKLRLNILGERGNRSDFVTAKHTGLSHRENLLGSAPTAGCPSAPYRSSRKLQSLARETIAGALSSLRVFTLR